MWYVKRKYVIGLGVLFVLALTVILVLPKLKLYFAGEKVTLNNSTKAFFIDDYTDLMELADKLKKDGFIDDIESFIEIGEYKNLNAEKIALGKYMIEPRTTFKDLLNGFTINKRGNGNAEVEVKVSFNNCKGMYQLDDLSRKAASTLMVDSATISSYLNDPKTYAKYGFTKEQFPAMFIPDTYRMFYDTDEKEFTERMAQEFKHFWTAERKGQLRNIGLKSPSELYTLASMVYLEQSRLKEEWSDISKLYLNRLEINMKLQSDPTFVYCWGDELRGVTRLLYKHRDIDCEYNTYKIHGLPPGPICLVNHEVLKAVLYPSDVNYLYMYGDGTRHYFSRHYGTHLRNTRK